MARSYRFEPEVIEVPAGSSVTWRNEDNFTHDVTFSGGTEPGQHVAEPGDQVTLMFDEPGTFDYVCTFHSTDMRGTVIVS